MMRPGRANRRAACWRSTSTSCASATATRSRGAHRRWWPTWFERTPRASRGRTRSAPPGPCRILQGGSPSFEKHRELAGAELQADEKRPELGIIGARLIEAHLVDQSLEDER